MVLFSTRKISKDYRALIDVSRQRTGAHNVVSRYKNWTRTRVDRLRKKIIPLLGVTFEKQWPVATGDQLARRHKTCGGAHLQSRKCFAHLQKSVQN